MHGKEFFVDLIRTYFILVTLITVGILVMGSYFEPNACFGYEAFAAPLIYGGCGVLPNAVMYTRRELTIKELLARKAIQLILIEGIVLSVAFWNTDICSGQSDIVIGMGVCILLIYVLAHVIDWLQAYISAKRLTEELMNLQKTANDASCTK